LKIQKSKCKISHKSVKDTKTKIKVIKATQKHDDSRTQKNYVGDNKGEVFNFSKAYERS